MSDFKDVQPGTRHIQTASHLSSGAGHFVHVEDHLPAHHWKKTTYRSRDRLIKRQSMVYGDQKNSEREIIDTSRLDDVERERELLDAIQQGKSHRHANDFRTVANAYKKLMPSVVNMKFLQHLNREYAKNEYVHSNQHTDSLKDKFEWDK